MVSSFFIILIILLEPEEYCIAFIYISKKRYNVPYEISIKFLESIVLPYVQILPLSEVEYKKASEILKINNVKPSDALHIAVMIINNITKIASEDKELDKIKGIERIWLS